MINNKDVLQYVNGQLEYLKFHMNEEASALNYERWWIIKEALEQQDKLQTVLDMVDKEALELQVEDFPEGCANFRGFRAGMCNAVERIDDLMNGDRM